jgi:arginine decarboxylase
VWCSLQVGTVKQQVLNTQSYDVLSDIAMRCAGFQAAEWLAAQGIATELATSSLVLAAFGAGSTMQDASRLIAALESLCQHFSSTLAKTEQLPTADAAVQVCSNLPVAAALPRDVQFAATERWAHSLYTYVHAPYSAHTHPLLYTKNRMSTMYRDDSITVAPYRVPWGQAAGRICAELLCPYPPGIPAVVPGEILTAAVLADLRQVLQAGGVVTGAADAELQWIGVVSNDTEAQEWRRC